MLVMYKSKEKKCFDCSSSSYIHGNVFSYYSDSIFIKVKVMSLRSSI